MEAASLPSGVKLVVGCWLPSCNSNHVSSERVGLERKVALALGVEALGFWHCLSFLCVRIFVYVMF